MGEAQNARGAACWRASCARAGLRVELGDGSFRLKKSFETADKLARKIVILGEDEAAIRYPDSEGLCDRRADEGAADRTAARST